MPAPSHATSSYRPEGIAQASIAPYRTTRTMGTSQSQRENRRRCERSVIARDYLEFGVGHVAHAAGILTRIVSIRRPPLRDKVSGTAHRRSDRPPHLTHV